jgi:hypothetical protein
MLNLGYEAEVVRAFEAATIVGNNSAQGDPIDMAGAEAVAFVIEAGTIGVAGLTVTAQQSSDNFVADVDTLAGSEVVFANADDDLIAIIDIGKPVKRYLRINMAAGANDCVVDSVLAIIYRQREVPVTQGATVAKAVVLVSPAAV